VLATTFGRRQLRKTISAPPLPERVFTQDPTADIDHLWDTASAVTKSVFLGATRAKSLDYPFGQTVRTGERAHLVRKIYSRYLGVLPPEFSL